MRWSKFGLQAGQQFGMHAGVDFTLQNLLCALDGQVGDLLTQCLTSLDDLLLGFSLGSGDDLGGFFGGADLGVVDQRLGAALGIGQAGGGFVARLDRKSTRLNSSH